MNSHHGIKIIKYVFALILLAILFFYFTDLPLPKETVTPEPQEENVITSEENVETESNPEAQTTPEEEEEPLDPPEFVKSAGENLNTYVNNSKGFEFTYPSTYSDPTTGWRWGEYDLHLLIQDPETNNLTSAIHYVSESVEGWSCTGALCDVEALEQHESMGITWDFLGNKKYCDAGHCSPERSIYRTLHEGHRHYLYFENVPSEFEIVSSFTFME